MNSILVMDNWFRISHFNISGKPIPEDVADKILEFHLIPGNRVRNAVGFPIWPSIKSAYRSYEWEKSKGRDGNSQHTFRAEGATDWTCHDFENNKGKLIHAIIENTDYNRICLYETFAHCDYAGMGKKFFVNENGVWKYKCSLVWKDVNAYL